MEDLEAGVEVQLVEVEDRLADVVDQDQLAGEEDQSVEAEGPPVVDINDQKAGVKDL